MSGHARGAERRSRQPVARFEPSDAAPDAKDSAKDVAFGPPPRCDNSTRLEPRGGSTALSPGPHLSVNRSRAPESPLGCQQRARGPAFFRPHLTSEHLTLTCPLPHIKGGY
eukprot:4423268-Prymnesium_polylepis.1